MKYRISRFVVTADPQSRTILHKKTGTRMLVSEETLELLKFFSEPISLEEVAMATSSDNEEKEEIQCFLRKLAEEKIIVSNDDEEVSVVGVCLEAALLEKPARSFFSCPVRDLYSLTGEEIVFLGAPFDLGTTGYPGTRFGPDKIRDLSSDAFEYHADIFTGRSKGWFDAVKDKTVLSGIRMADVGNAVLRVGEGFESFYDRLTSIADAIVDNGSFIVTVGGDHSCSYPVLRAIKKKYGRISVVHIDAHTDLGELLPGIPNNHGNVFTKIRQENLISGLYQMGVRVRVDKKIAEPCYSLWQLDALKRHGVATAVNELPEDECCYLTVDIDVLDPVFAPGTGTPIANGMNPDMLFELLSAITQRVKVVGCDIVEVNPMLDRNNLTAEIAVETLFRLLSDVFKVR